MVYDIRKTCGNCGAPEDRDTECVPGNNKRRSSVAGNKPLGLSSGNKKDEGERVRKSGWVEMGMKARREFIGIGK
jgi:hypothetical protein